VISTRPEERVSKIMLLFELFRKTIEN